MEQVLLVLTNVPDEAAACALARRLIEQRVAACVNILPKVRSVYRWQGALEEADEVTLLIKATQIRYPELEVTIKNAHPYKVPEIIAVPVVAGLPAYLKWVEEGTGGETDA
jgi:periplasmic divalent cation tolerance protein